MKNFLYYSLLKSPLKWKFIFFLICLKPSLIIVHKNCCWFLPERKTLRLREQIAGGECSTGRWRQEENQILCTGSAPSKSEDTWSEGESIVCSNPFPDIKDLDEKRKIFYLGWETKSKRFLLFTQKLSQSKSKSKVQFQSQSQESKSKSKSRVQVKSPSLNSKL